jgi:hypothetical protein
MSSLAASRADNFYYPPEWRPEYGGISKFQGSKGKNQYEQRGKELVRFEARNEREGRGNNGKHGCVIVLPLLSLLFGGGQA